MLTAWLLQRNCQFRALDSRFRGNDGLFSYLLTHQ